LDTQRLLVTDVFIFKQESSSGGTDIEGADLGAGIFELLGAGVDPEKIKLWWHSHGNMGVFFSGTDTNTMDTNPNLTGSPFFISIVGNKAHDYNVRFDQHSPLRFWADGLQLWIDTDDHCSARQCYRPPFITEDDKVADYCEKHLVMYGELKEEVKTKVSPPKSTTVVYSGSTWTGKYGYKRLNEEVKEYDPSIVNDYWSQTTYCRYGPCYARIMKDRDYCSEHGGGAPPLGTPERKDENKDERVASVTSVIDLDADGQWDYCDATGCPNTINVLEAFIKGVSFCDEHQKDMDELEVLFGEFDDVPADTIVDIVDYYSGSKGSLDEQDLAIIAEMAAENNGPSSSVMSGADSEAEAISKMIAASTDEKDDDEEDSFSIIYGGEF
jgi:hypothetical protein